MHDDEWCNLLKRYQAAASILHDAVDRLTAPGSSFPHSWECAEKARIEVNRSYAAILNHEPLNRERRHFAAAAAAGHGHEATMYETEELVLGDQGQSGG